MTIKNKVSQELANEEVTPQERANRAKKTLLEFASKFLAASTEEKEQMTKELNELKEDLLNKNDKK